jgi:hypothetical protein
MNLHFHNRSVMKYYEILNTKYRIEKLKMTLERNVEMYKWKMGNERIFTN